MWGSPLYRQYFMITKCLLEKDLINSSTGEHQLLSFAQHLLFWENLAQTHTCPVPMSDINFGSKDGGVAQYHTIRELQVLYPTGHCN